MGINAINRAVEKDCSGCMLFYVFSHYDMNEMSMIRGICSLIIPETACRPWFRGFYDMMIREMVKFSM